MQPPSDFNLPTFIVAAVGAVSGLFSATWNVVPYISSGAKIRVTIHYVFDVPRGPVFEVNAYNRRRGPVEIRQWGVRTYHLGSSREYTTVLLPATELESSDELPKTIQGKHGATWRVLARDLVVFEHNREHAVRVRGVVELGNGKESRSKLLKLPATSLHQVPRIVDDE
jgi:hypothetical protein